MTNLTAVRAKMNDPDDGGSVDEVFSAFREAMGLLETVCAVSKFHLTVDEFPKAKEIIDLLQSHGIGSGE